MSKWQLLGEDITSPWNRQCLQDMAIVFGAEYQDIDEESANLHQTYELTTLIAAENQPQARPIYNYRPNSLGTHALIMGNEAKGLRRRTLKQADITVEIPVFSRTVNCLNVATAAAVLLYYLTTPTPYGYEKQTLTSIRKRRPDLLLIAGKEPLELGSALRSAGALGWERVFLSDPHHVWFECDRVIKSTGRGAARRGRNPIRIIPWQSTMSAHYQRTFILHTAPQPDPLPRLPLVSLRPTLVVLGADNALEETFLATEPSLVLPDLRQYHLSTTIALAEIARQLGNPTSITTRPGRYQRAMTAAQPTGIIVELEDLFLF